MKAVIIEIMWMAAGIIRRMMFEAVVIMRAYCLNMNDPSVDCTRRRAKAVISYTSITCVLNIEVCAGRLHSHFGASPLLHPRLYSHYKGPPRTLGIVFHKMRQYPSKDILDPPLSLERDRVRCNVLMFHGIISTYVG